jgi:hypothetical protein
MNYCTYKIAYAPLQRNDICPVLLLLLSVFGLVSDNLICVDVPGLADTVSFMVYFLYYS